MPAHGRLRRRAPTYASRLSIAALPGATRTVSSKTTRTLRGAWSSTAPFAGVVRSSVAWADATAGKTSAPSATRRGEAPRARADAAEAGASLAAPLPIYEYKCPNGHLFDAFHGMTEPGPTCCPECGEGPLQVVLHPVAVHYKGSGFYSTDYGRKSKQPVQGRRLRRLVLGLVLRRRFGRRLRRRFRRRLERLERQQESRRGLAHRPAHTPRSGDCSELSTFTSPICDVFGATLGRFPGWVGVRDGASSARSSVKEM